MRMLIAFDNELTEWSLHYRVYNLEENRVENWNDEKYISISMSKEEYLSYKYYRTTVLEVNCELNKEAIIKCVFETYPELLL